MEKKLEATPEPSKPVAEDPLASVPLRQRRLPASFWQEPSRLPEPKKYDLSSQLATLQPYANQLNLTPAFVRQQAPPGVGTTTCPCLECFVRTTAFYYPVRWTIPYCSHPAASNAYSALYCQFSSPCRQPCKECESLRACNPSRIGNRKSHRYHPLQL